MDDLPKRKQKVVLSSPSYIEECEECEVPTFSSMPVGQTLDIHVETLTDPAAANALRAADPFAYYTCFTPTNTLRQEIIDVLAAKPSEEDPSQPKIIKVACQRRVSAECDAFAVGFRGTQDTIEAHHGADGEAGIVSTFGLQSMIGMGIAQDIDDGDDECILNMLKKQ